MKKIYTSSVIFLTIVFSCNAQALTNALRIKIARGNYSDETVIRFTSGATNGFDGSYDAWKLFSYNTSVPNIFSKDSAGDELSINAMPAFTASVYKDIFLSIGAAATYSITPSEIGPFDASVKIMMKDLVTGQFYNMRSASTFTINLPAIAEKDSARFRILFSYPSSVQTNYTSCSNCSDGSAVISKDGMHNWQYLVWNSSSIICSGVSSGNSQTVNGLAAGTYTVAVNSDFGCNEIIGFTVKSPVTYYSRTNGDWNNPSSWSTKVCGGPAASSAPGNGDNVNICAGKKITLNSPASCNSISINGTLTCNADLSVSGNWTNTGTFSAGTRTVIFNGRKLQLIAGSATTFNNLFVNNSAPVEAVRLNAPVTVNGILSLKDGHITTSASKLLTCGTASSISLLAIPQDSSFVKGPMAQIVNTAMPVIKIFPVGKNSSYRRIDVMIDQRTNSKTFYTAEMFENPVPAAGYSLPQTVQEVSSVRYWQINQSAPTLLDSASVKIYFGCAGNSDRVTSMNQLSIVKDNGKKGWLDLKNSTSGNNCDKVYYTGIASSKAFTSFTGNKFCLATEGNAVREEQSEAETNVRPEKENPSVTVFPNPASEFFFVKFSGPDPGKVKVAISDLAGKICFEQTLISEGDIARINLSENLNPGIYFVSVNYNSTVETKKLIIK